MKYKIDLEFKLSRWFQRQWHECCFMLIAPQRRESRSQWLERNLGYMEQTLETEERYFLPSPYFCNSSLGNVFKKADNVLAMPSDSFPYHPTQIFKSIFYFIYLSVCWGRCLLDQINVMYLEVSKSIETWEVSWGNTEWPPAQLKWKRRKKRGRRKLILIVWRQQENHGDHKLERGGHAMSTFSWTVSWNKTFPS